MRKSTLILLACLAVLAFASAALRAQDSVTLQSSARLGEGEAFTLGTIARVVGPRSERLNAIALPVERGAPGAWVRVDAQMVRDVLRTELGDRAETIALTGSGCDVRFAGDPAPKASRRDNPPPPGHTLASSIVDSPTVRGLIALRLCEALGVPPPDVRLSFDHSDGSLLDTPLAGRVVEASVAGVSSRIPVSVRVFEPDGLAAALTIRVGAQVRRMVAVATGEISRGTLIDPSMVVAEERWLAPNEDAAGAEHVVGSVARVRLGSGDPIARRLVEAPVIIRKGDIVTVAVVGGWFVVEEPGRALAPGREGEEVEFASLDGTGRRFRARATGHGHAVVWLNQPGTPIASDAPGAGR